MAEARTRRRRVGAEDVGGPTIAPVGLHLHRRGRPRGALALDDTQPYAIGRGAQADVCFDDDAVSRVHAHLKREPAGWVVVDARSANGTFVADGGDMSTDAARAARFGTAPVHAPGTPHVLAPGDVVFFGDAHAAIEALAVVERDDARGEDRAAHAAAASSARGERLARDLARAARTRGPALLIGPSGAGKTHAARAIHEQSGRRGRFIALNAAALPHDPTQLRAVLLGHKKGAFTGADADVEGAWRAADGGTLFLDEVDSLAPPAQAFLLTLLEQSGDLAPLGAPGKGAAPVDVRVVTASKTSLADAGLREDLAFRLVDGAIIEIPSLAERREDIPALVRALLDELAREDGVAAPFGDDAIAACARAAWPGEIRQLRGVVRLLSREALSEGRAHVGAAEVEARLASLSRALGAPSVSAARAAPPPAASPAPKKARQLTRDDIAEALAAEQNNMQRAANRLGIARNTLLTKMEQFGIARPRRD